MGWKAEREVKRLFNGLGERDLRQGSSRSSRDVRRGTDLRDVKDVGLT